VVKLNTCRFHHKRSKTDYDKEDTLRNLFSSNLFGHFDPKIDTNDTKSEQFPTKFTSWKNVSCRQDFIYTSRLRCLHQVLIFFFRSYFLLSDVTVSPLLRFKDPLAITSNGKFLKLSSVEDFTTFNG